VELLQLEHFGQTLRLQASVAGWQQLYWGDQIVSQLSATENKFAKSTHHFEFSQAVKQTASIEAPQITKCRLEIVLNWQPFAMKYQLFVDDSVVQSGQKDNKDIEQQVPIKTLKVEKKTSKVGLFSLLFKLFKSAKIIKVVLAGASLAAYSWFFSFQFALALIACLVFHEYGHIRAMRYFSMQTKGIYLIPFVGGLALTDQKINTRWQDVVISIMGPTFGLILSCACLLGYWFTGSPFLAGLAVFNALLNLFNLLPILPLDGGHILKSISFSMNSKIGLVACVLGAALGVFVSYRLGLALLGFLLLIGSLEIFFEWRTRFQSPLLPLDKYAQLVSAVWYLLTVAGLIAIIFYFASSGDQLLSLPLKILGS
jgi:Zn-dependent protease